MTVLICPKCGGNNVLQQASIMIDLEDLDDPNFHISVTDLHFDDYYYCVDCQDTTWPHEFEKNIIG